MFERFTEGARRATALASQEARQLGHDFIGTEHLLLGLLAAGEGVAFSVLAELDVTLDDVRRKVTERVHPYGSGASQGGGGSQGGASQGGSVDSPRFTPLAKKSLERALREALQLDASHIGSEHLLLGLVAVPDGGGARILVELAGNLDQVRQSVLAQVSPGPRPGQEAPREQTKAPVTSRTLRRWAAQSRTVLHLPVSPTEARPSPPAGAAGSLGPPPRCPACQSPLATGARYRRLAIPPGDDGRSEPDPATATASDPTAGATASDPTAAATAATPADPTAGATATDPTAGATATGAPDTDESGPGGARGDDVTVTVVYCGHCGVTLGIA